MKIHSFFLAILLLTIAPLARATQADDTTITITGQNAGPTPFISQLTLTASDTTVIKSIQFTVATKDGAFARPLSGTYSNDYMTSRGYIQGDSIFLPVYGLYSDFTNNVTLTYNFLDGSSKGDSTTITAAAFDDQGCGYANPTVLQARTGTSLSYDYIFVRSGCGDFSPVILDSDGALRWVSTLSVPNALTGSSCFVNNTVYEGIRSTLSQVDLDGTITLLGDYSGDGVTTFHHNIDPGKTGLILEADTTTQAESTLMEVDFAGNLLKTWSMADIISAAMIAGGDDPSQFVFPTPNDWFHNNAATYNRADDSLIISSRENFVICIDYETGAIKWILGDETKKWFEFPSLTQYALALTPGGLPPIGQHATSVTFDQHLLLFDDGLGSFFQMPPGITRTYASPRKYKIALNDPGTTGSPGTATLVWSYEQNQSIVSPICSSVYEDAPLNYLVDYALFGGFAQVPNQAQLLGLNATEDQAFYYQYTTSVCDTAYNSQPIHLENAKFPAVGPRALNFSTRGNVSDDDSTLIGGFIVTGTEDKTVALRLLGPSLADSGVTTAVSDPILTLHDSTGAIVATNDDWQSDPRQAELAGDGLAPTNTVEAATIQTLAPGAYTVVASGKDGATGVGLVEIYDLSAQSTSHLANLSTRGLVGTGENALINGFIVGDTANASTIIRALGPSLAAGGVSNPLQNPLLTVYDSNGVALAANDSWQYAVAKEDLEKNGLAPTDDLESALVLHPPAGAYTAIVVGEAGGSGVALVEVYDLD
jgi:hypothetical protein